MTELKYGYSGLDKKHCYYLLSAKNTFDTWILFYIGKNLTASGKDFKLYLFHPSWIDTKTILTVKVNSASMRGKMIAKKINQHYLTVSKKPIKI